jgi:hypothetical protein
MAFLIMYTPMGKKNIWKNNYIRVREISALFFFFNEFDVIFFHIAIFN